MLKDSAKTHPEIAEYFRELAVDFCVRFPEEATKQRETKEWESQKSAFSINNVYLVVPYLVPYTNMTHIIYSRNIYIDTSTGSGKGDEFNLELGANQISAADRQFLGLTSVSFNMYKNQLYPINETNNQFRVVSRYGPVQDASQFLGISTVNSITPKTYRTCGEIALAFAQSAQAQRSFTPHHQKPSF